jgi:hypothetical protein
MAVKVRKPPRTVVSWVRNPAATEECLMFGRGLWAGGDLSATVRRVRGPMMNLSDLSTGGEEPPAVTFKCPLS